jgi:endonuclease/exonuclease/phosphatase family metal-dependent hydrolase
MKAIKSLVLIGVGVALGWVLFSTGLLNRWNTLLLPVGGSSISGGLGASGELDRPDATIRIASFNIQVFGESKLAKPEVMQVLVDVVRQFDVVAIQEVRSRTQDVLPRFVQLLNAQGRQYDYALGPPLGRTHSTEQYAFVFDTQRLEIDRRALYTVVDPGDRLHREPLVAAFRVRGPPPDQAFTFTLVNIHTDPDEVESELAALDDVFRAVQEDGRGEDDVILLGDLNADDQNLGELGRLPLLFPAIVGQPTNVRRTRQYDNILLHRGATTEYTGTSGVLDFAAQYKLTPKMAKEVSDHFPVWAEFHTYEGGRPGYVAGEVPRRR